MRLSYVRERQRTFSGTAWLLGLRATPESLCSSVSNPKTHCFGLSTLFFVPHGGMKLGSKPLSTVSLPSVRPL